MFVAENCLSGHRCPVPRENRRYEERIRDLRSHVRLRVWLAPGHDRVGGHRQRLNDPSRPQRTRSGQRSRQAPFGLVERVPVTDVLAYEADPRSQPRPVAVADLVCERVQLAHVTFDEVEPAAVAVRDRAQDREAEHQQLADAMQAAYFRGCLADEREEVAAHAAKQRAEMASRLQTDRLSSMRRMQAQVRSLEAELRYLDGLIAKLDRRFAALWSARA